jgi:phospholipid/cholesterol/gamma-HCH transport system ATP-binding protein
MTIRDDDIAIRIEGLANRFGEQVVHENLDLSVRRGEIIGVVGGSGAGKSVLMRSILGLRHPDAGRIEVLGADARSDDEADRQHIERNTGVLFQDGALFSSLTVGENVQVPLKEQHPELPDSLRYELALLKVKLAGLPADALEKLPSQLSGGMRKRAGPGAGARAGPAVAVPRRAHRGPGPHRRRGLRRTHPHPAARAGPHRLPDHTRPRHALCICDRVAVLADKRVVVNAPIEEVERFDHPWVQQYFHGPRARAARQAGTGTAA